MSYAPSARLGRVQLGGSEARPEVSHVVPHFGAKLPMGIVLRTLRRLERLPDHADRDSMPSKQAFSLILGLGPRLRECAIHRSVRRARDGKGCIEGGALKVNRDGATSLAEYQNVSIPHALHWLAIDLED
jgi:hypothetical protein